MAVEVEELYLSLNQLLKDICKFLNDKENYEQLSPLARKEADKLINRSKKQLETLAKVGVDKNEEDEAYVDMERKPDNDEDDSNRIYSFVEEPSSNVPETTNKLEVIPYAELPALELKPDTKQGNLYLKYRFLLKFEKARKIYAGIHEDWLLIYTSMKDSRPIQMYHLKYHKADPVFPKNKKNNFQDFTLISTKEDGKVLNFIAQTHKDMLQWVAFINRIHKGPPVSKLETTSKEDPTEIYDMVANADTYEEKHDDDDDEDSIYYEIERSSQPNQPIKQPIPVKPPELPARQGIKTIKPLPPVRSIPQEVDTPSNPETELKSLKESTSTSSFTDTEEEEIYDSFVSPQKLETKENDNEEPSEIYANEVPNTFMQKPKITPKPPTPFLPSEKIKNANSLKKRLV